MEERESRRQKFIADMMAGNFDQHLASRYKPPSWLLATMGCQGVGMATAPDNGVRGPDTLEKTERLTWVLSRIHSRKYREFDTLKYLYFFNTLSDFLLLLLGI